MVYCNLLDDIHLESLVLYHHILKMLLLFFYQLQESVLIVV